MGELQVVGAIRNAGARRRILFFLFLWCNRRRLVCNCAQWSVLVFGCSFRLRGRLSGLAPPRKLCERFAGQDFQAGAERSLIRPWHFVSLAFERRNFWLLATSTAISISRAAAPAARPVVVIRARRPRRGRRRVRHTADSASELRRRSLMPLDFSQHFARKRLDRGDDRRLRSRLRRNNRANRKGRRNRWNRWSRRRGG